MVVIFGFDYKGFELWLNGIVKVCLYMFLYYCSKFERFFHTVPYFWGFEQIICVWKQCSCQNFSSISHHKNLERYNFIFRKKWQGEKSFLWPQKLKIKINVQDSFKSKIHSVYTKLYILKYSVYWLLFDKNIIYTCFFFVLLSFSLSSLLLLDPSWSFKLFCWPREVNIISISARREGPRSKCGLWEVSSSLISWYSWSWSGAGAGMWSSNKGAASRSLCGLYGATTWVGTEPYWNLSIYHKCFIGWQMFWLIVYYL